MESHFKNSRRELKLFLHVYVKKTKMVQQEKRVFMESNHKNSLGWGVGSWGGSQGSMTIFL